MSRYYSDEEEPGDDSMPFVEPDRSKSDYYCKMCDSHMNSCQMWDSHVSGKRHMKNMKKEPGEPPSKIKAVKQEGARPFIQRELDKVDEPLLGLKYISEKQHPENSSLSNYTCYLCHATTPKTALVDHILSMKHRLNFFRMEDAETFSLIEMMHLKKGAKETIVEEKAAEWENDHGRQMMEVKMPVSKSALPGPAVNRARYYSSRYIANQTYDGKSGPQYLTGSNSVPLASSSSAPTAAAPVVPSPPPVPPAPKLRKVDWRNVKLLPLSLKLHFLKVATESPHMSSLPPKELMNMMITLLQTIGHARLRCLSAEGRTKFTRMIMGKDVQTYDQHLQKINSIRLWLMRPLGGDDELSSPEEEE